MRRVTPMGLATLRVAMRWLTVSSASVLTTRDRALTSDTMAFAILVPNPISSSLTTTAPSQWRGRPEPGRKTGLLHGAYDLPLRCRCMKHIGPELEGIDTTVLLVAPIVLVTVLLIALRALT